MVDSHEAAEAIRPALWATGLLAVGIIALALSLFWPGEVAGHGSWSLGQAKAYQDASIKLHSLSQQGVAAAGSEKEKSIRQNLAKAETEFKALKSDLAAGLYHPKRI